MIAPKIGSSGGDPVRQEDQVISVESEIDFQIQRGREEVEKQRKSHLERRRQENAGWLLDIP